MMVSKCLVRTAPVRNAKYLYENTVLHQDLQSQVFMKLFLYFSRDFLLTGVACSNSIISLCYQVPIYGDYCAFPCRVLHLLSELC